MNMIMIVEIVIIAAFLSAGLIIWLVLRHKLKEYDGMGQVKRMDEEGKEPPRIVL